MAKYTRIVKNIVLTILFLGLFIMMLARVMYVFREKSDNLVQDRFAALEPDSVDTVFIGTAISSVRSMRICSMRNIISIPSCWQHLHRPCRCLIMQQWRR